MYVAALPTITAPPRVPTRENKTDKSRASQSPVEVSFPLHLNLRPCSQVNLKEAHREKIEKSFALLTVFLLLLFGLSFPGEGARVVTPQDAAPIGDLRWTKHTDGFAGVYTFGKQNFAVESYHPSRDFALTRILKPGGIKLIEILRSDQIVSLTVGDSTVSFDLGDPSSFTEKEQSVLQSALDSQDARVGRRIVAATIFQLKREGLEKRFLVGLGVASIVLGGEPRQTGLSSNLSTVTTAVIPEECSADNCLGCCGSGCTGCIGCCTEACQRHDACVRQFGQLRCLILLPAAIVSIFLECF